MMYLMSKYINKSITEAMLDHHPMLVGANRRIDDNL